MESLIPLGSLVLGLLIGWLIQYLSNRGLTKLYEWTITHLSTENLDLRNRIQSQDLATYHSMTAISQSYNEQLTVSEDESVLHSDEGEIYRLKRMHGEDAATLVSDEFDLSDLVGSEFDDNSRR